MKLNARNQIKGKILSIEPGSVNDVVVLDIGNSNKISAVITKESVKNLGLKAGGEAFAVIKASSVMIGVNE